MSAQTAAISQLLMTGKIDRVLYDNPTVTFWRSAFYRATIFSLENQLLQYDSGSQIVSGKSTVTLQRTGDLVHRMYAIIDLPGIANVASVDATKLAAHMDSWPADSGAKPTDIQTTGTCAGEAVEFDSCMAYAQGGGLPLWGSASSDTEGDSRVAYWCQGVGYRLMKQAEMQIGAQGVETIYSDFMFINDELSQKPQKSIGEMVGLHSTDAIAMAKSKMARRLYVPLPFSCTKSASHSLPIVSLQFHQVRVAIDWAQIESCIVNASGVGNSPVLKYTIDDAEVVLTTVVRSKEDYGSILKPSRTLGAIQKYGYTPPVAAKSPNVNTTAPIKAIEAGDVPVKYEAQYVYLDTDERKKFSTGSFQMLMSTPKHATVYNQDNTNLSIDLDFNHSVQQLLWMVRSKHNTDTKDHYNFGGVQEPVTGIIQDPIVHAEISLNNSNRTYKDAPGSYFRMVQPYQHSTRMPAAFVYGFSFALTPDQHENPSGGCNFSRIDSRKLKLTLDENLFKDNTAAGGKDLSSNRVDVSVYAKTHNLLRIMGGLGGLAFA